MLTTKVVIEELPTGGDDKSERRIFSDKGEMVQVLNRGTQSFKHLVYWELDSARTEQERGHHYHEKKAEQLYVISGELELLLEDLETSERRAFTVRGGTRITIPPRIAHAYHSHTYSQVLEYSPDPYDPSDTHPHRVTI